MVLWFMGAALAGFGDIHSLWFHARSSPGIYVGELVELHDDPEQKRTSATLRVQEVLTGAACSEVVVALPASKRGVPCPRLTGRRSSRFSTRSRAR